MGDVDSHPHPDPLSQKLCRGSTWFNQPPGASNTSEVWDPCSLSSSSFGSLALGTICFVGIFIKPNKLWSRGGCPERPCLTSPVFPPSPPGQPGLTCAGDHQQEHGRALPEHLRWCPAADLHADAQGLIPRFTNSALYKDLLRSLSEKAVEA